MGRGNSKRSKTLQVKNRTRPVNIEPEAKTGLPRPFATDSKGGKYPVPFSNWGRVYSEDPVFSKFDAESLKAFVDSDFSICDTCGEKLGKNMVFGLQDTPSYPEETDGSSVAYVSGLPMHPRCALIAAAYCPHFKKWNEDNGPIFATAEASQVDFKNRLEAYLSNRPKEDYLGSLVGYFAQYNLDSFEGVYLEEIKRLAEEEKSELS